MKGTIFDGKRKFTFENLRALRIEANGKPWVFEHITEKQLRFNPAPLGGYAGTGNYLASWRKRRKITQTEAGKIFEVSPSSISKIEKGERAMPEKIFEHIRRDILKYGRATPWGE